MAVTVNFRPMVLMHTKENDGISSKHILLDYPESSPIAQVAQIQEIGSRPLDHRAAFKCSLHFPVEHVLEVVHFHFIPFRGRVAYRAFVVSAELFGGQPSFVTVCLRCPLSPMPGTDREQQVDAFVVIPPHSWKGASPEYGVGELKPYAVIPLQGSSV